MSNIANIVTLSEIIQELYNQNTVPEFLEIMKQVFRNLQVICVYCGSHDYIYVKAAHTDSNGWHICKKK